MYLPATCKYTSTMDTNGSGSGVQHEEEVVIVGGGIGGLACALALHRYIVARLLYQKAASYIASLSICVCSTGPAEDIIDSRQ